MKESSFNKPILILLNKNPKLIDKTWPRIPNPQIPKPPNQGTEAVDIMQWIP